MLRYDEIVLIDNSIIKHHNGLLYDRQPFHNRTSVEHLGLDCKVEYTNANQGIMPKAHNIWVQYMQSEENNLNNPSKDELLLFWSYILAGLNQIRSTNFRSACQLAKQYPRFLKGATRPNNGYYVLKLKNTWW